METGYSGQVEARHTKKDSGSRPGNRANDRKAEMLAKTASFEKRYSGQPQEVLEHRLEELNAIVGNAETELTFRKLVSQGKDQGATKSFHKDASDAKIERLVIQKMLPTEGEVIAVSPDKTRSEAVDRTIQVEVARERAEVLAEERKQAAQIEKQMDQLVKGRLGSSGDIILGTHRRDTRRRDARAEALKKMPRDKMTQEVSFESGGSRSEVERPVVARQNRVEDVVDRYAVKSARKSPENFWSRFKRSMFGSVDESYKKSQADAKAMDKILRAEKVRLKQETRLAQVQDTRTSVRTQRELVKRTGVISARKKEETKETGILGGLWKRLTGQAQREARSAGYRANIEKVGGRPEYALNPKLEIGRSRIVDKYAEISPDDLEEVSGDEEDQEVA
jgi:hypothetical protein